LSKALGQLQQRSQSFDCEHLRVRMLYDGLLAIGVRPRPRNLHRAAVEVLNDDAMWVRLEDLELSKQ
jgi:hypothetical protein